MAVMEAPVKTKMKATVRDRFGAPDVIEVREVDVPTPAADELLVRIRAASINMADWYGIAGRPLVGRPMVGLRHPKEPRIGVDYAGIVEAVGDDVTSFRPGDEVFGGRTGAYAEYVVAREEGGVVGKPENVTFEEAAAVPIAALTALQGLRDKGGLEPGHSVLVNGASGGVGTYAVQVARALGAEVSAVCSTHNVDTARALGAEHVVDYTRADFTRSGRTYDLVFDVAGSRPWPDLKRILKPQGTLVIVGAPKGTRLLGPLGHIIGTRVRSLGSGRKVVFFIAKFNKPDMQTLADMLASGQIRSVVERTYELSEIREAFAYFGEGHARGKIVLTV